MSDRYKNEDGSYRFIKTMKAQEHIDKTREYLDYVEEHINNVRKAFIDVSDACEGLPWVGDDMTWHALCNEVERHDISKLSAQELCQYRDTFYPCEGESPDQSEFAAAWDHHKAKNPHHHETVKTYVDLIHMVIDWTAMGYKFGDTAQSYYEKNSDKISLTESQIKSIYEVFDRISGKS